MIGEEGGGDTGKGFAGGHLAVATCQTDGPADFHPEIKLLIPVHTGERGTATDQGAKQTVGDWYEITGRCADFFPDISSGGTRRCRIKTELHNVTAVGDGDIAGVRQLALVVEGGGGGGEGERG